MAPSLTALTFFLLVLVPDTLHEDHAKMVAACEAAIMDRIPVAGTYRRLGFDISDHALSREEYAKMLDGIGAANKALDKFDAGILRPREVGITIDYEATDTDATVHQKRSFCSLMIMRPYSPIPFEMMRVDGFLKIGNDWIPAKK